MNELVARTCAAYAGCRSYRDMGEAAVMVARGSKPWQRTTCRFPFQTAFVRPARLLFEWKAMGVGPHSEWPHAALWRNARGLFAWETNVELSEPALTSGGSLAEVLERWSPACGGAATAVPRLLGVLEGPNPLDGLQPAGEDEIDGVAARRLEKSVIGGVFVAWIALERPLLLRTFSRLRHSPERDAALRSLAARAELSPELRQLVAATPALESERMVETTLFLRPELDPELDDSAFELTPPR
ncbi:MAG: hypothetical protein FJ298_03820 [Planctomycetes bacterium]|nr:hypothetical protein [Planctomycetota bacterium]